MPVNGVETSIIPCLSRWTNQEDLVARAHVIISFTSRALALSRPKAANPMSCRPRGRVQQHRYYLEPAPQQTCHHMICVICDHREQRRDSIMPRCRTTSRIIM